MTGFRQGKTSTQKQPTIEPIDYQKNLDQGLPTSQLTADDVRYWSDFNRVFYHPRSIVQLNEYDLNSQLMPFENWNAGQDLFKDLDKEFDLLDRDMRPFAEECDQLAGIQIFTTVDDAWGGFSSSYIDLLRDEYGKTSIWLWGVEDGMRVSRVMFTLKSCWALHSYRSSKRRSVGMQTWRGPSKQQQHKSQLISGFQALLPAFLDTSSWIDLLSGQNRLCCAQR